MDSHINIAKYIQLDQYRMALSLMEICQTENVETVRPHDSLLWRADQTKFYGRINGQQ